MFTREVVFDLFDQQSIKQKPRKGLLLILWVFYDIITVMANKKKFSIEEEKDIRSCYDSGMSVNSIENLAFRKTIHYYTKMD